MSELKGWLILVEQVKMSVNALNRDGTDPKYIADKLKEALDIFGAKNRMDAIDWGKPFDGPSWLLKD